MELWHPVVKQTGTDVSEKLLLLSSELKEQSKVTKKELQGVKT
jgi:hypothetical protein